MPSIHDGHRKRMKEEFLSRPDSFPDHKVLEVLLFSALPRVDTNPIAHDLLDKFNSIAGVLDALPEEMQKVSGVGESTAFLLKSVQEVARRYAVEHTEASTTVDGLRDACALMRPYFFGRRTERAVVLCMDNKKRPLGIYQISEGTVNFTHLVVRNVVEVALSVNATQVVLAHNHVAGLAYPSPEDKVSTQYLAKALNMVGIHLVDHLIFTDDDVISLRDIGLPFLKPSEPPKLR